MRIVLVGQPNCGKSTIFNSVAGYRAATANFPGTTVSFTTSRVLIAGQEVEIVDLPGTYSLTSHDEAERVALRYLLETEASVLVNVVDASRLGRSLELTLQLLELRRPLVVALNMTDEAQRKGIEIDARALTRELAAPVVPTIARRGVGLIGLFAVALDVARGRRAPPLPRYDAEVEGAASRVESLIACGAACAQMPARLTALKLLERDPRVRDEMAGAMPTATAVQVEQAAAFLEDVHGWPGDQVIAGARHGVAHGIEERVSRVGRPRSGWREQADRILMHPVLGIPVLIVILALLFAGVFLVGKWIEDPLVGLFDSLAGVVARGVPPTTPVGAVLKGVILGISGGVAIVAPYLVPFLIALAVLEDTGYLPRIAYLLDGVMHRMGLHGKSIVPLMLGYGCSVPAVMSTRILETSRDRRITATLAVLVPCSARTTVILGLVGAVLGLVPALVVYAVNLLVIGIVGVALQRTMKGAPPGLILEVPDLRPPSFAHLGARTWVSLREFIVAAWPALIASSVVLGLLEIGRLDRPINSVMSPLTVGVLGLPAAVGLTLVFGVLRKELALMMLVQALGTTQLAGVLTPPQMISFALFTVFYIPCVATIAALWRELGWKDTAWISALSVVLALIVATAGRFVAAAIY